MLVLSRKLGERIVIGGDITLEVLDIRKGNIKLGISAAPEVSIHREEIADALLGPVKVDRLAEVA